MRKWTSDILTLQKFDMRLRDLEIKYRTIPQEKARMKEELEAAQAEVRKAKEVRISREKLENTAKEYGNLAELQYINGVTNYMDVMDAQREYLDAQLGLNNAILDELLSIVDLYKALGGGL